MPSGPRALFVGSFAITLAAAACGLDVAGTTPVAAPAPHDAALDQSSMPDSIAVDDSGNLVAEDADVPLLDASGADAADSLAPPPRLPVNGDFETLGPGCGPPWDQAGWHSAYARSSNARTGLAACEVCAEGSATVFSLDPGHVVQDARKGQRYRIRAFVRRAPSSATHAIDTFVAIRVFAGGSTIDSKYGAATPLTDAWQEFSLEHVLGGDGIMNGYVSLDDDAHGCVLVDDLEIVRLQ